MKNPREIRRSVLAWGLTGLVWLAGVASFRGAAREWTAYHPVASVALAPDGQECRTLPLHSCARFDYRVVIEGTFHGRLNGLTYDARDSSAPGDEPRPHNALELSPAELAPLHTRESLSHRVLRSIPFLQHAGGGVHRWGFVPEPGVDLAGRPVAARLEPERLTAGMYLPEGAEPPFDGTLRLVVWERDRWRQSAAAGAWLLLGTAMSGWSLARLRVHRRGRTKRLTPRRGSELALRMERLRQRRGEALAALASSPAVASLLRGRVEALSALAEELASATEAYARAAGLAAAPRCARGARCGVRGARPTGLPSLDPASAPAREEAVRRYQEYLARLEQIEAAFAALPTRLASSVSTTAVEADALTHAIEVELGTLRAAAEELEAMETA